MKGLQHSIAQRLLNISRREGVDNNLITMRYAAERLLYRLGNSKYAEHFILKGAVLFWAWYGRGYRTTKDVDLLGIGMPDMERLKGIFQEICRMDIQGIDGMIFLPETVQTTMIQEQQNYPGIRINLSAGLAQIKVSLQIDIGFGDAVTPAAEKMSFPTILEMPSPEILTYPKYTVLAEKFMAMVVLGMENSRMKDFYDLMVMLRKMDFDWDLVEKAVRATFTTRKNSLPEGMPVALTTVFGTDKLKTVQWNAFVNRSRLTEPIGQLSDVIQEIGKGLRPLWSRLKIDF